MMARNMEIVYKIDNISFSYEKTAVFKNASADIRKGEFVSIVGDNGAGKSTLIKLMLNIIKPSEGKIYILGHELSDFHKWSDIGYVSQNAVKSSIGFPATVEEVVKDNLPSDIDFMKFVRKRHRYMTIKALEQVGMQQYAKRLIGNLSAGQQQRVMIARALVKNPKVLILDEPAAGIDYKSKITLYTLLRKLNKNLDVTIIMITHNKDCAGDFVNRILKVDNKKIYH